MKKRLTALLLTMVLIIGLMPNSAWAEEAVKIDTAEKFAAMDAKGNYKLAADITLTEPYGSSSKPFAGTFDGDGHTVTLDINTKYTYQGVFAYCKDAKIHRLVVKGNIKTTLGYAASITPKAENCTIENCATEVNITCSGTNSTNFGGIAGYINNTTIKNCCSNSSISGKIKNVGGIAGQINTTASTIENCYNWGNIVSTATSSPRVGGIVGYGNIASTIKNCYNAGTITCSAQTGALAGYLCENLAVTNCFYLTGTHNLAVGFAVSGADTNGITEKSSDELKTLTSTLGEAFYNVNNGYPILSWQAATETTKVPVVSVSVDGTARLGKKLTAQAKGADDAAPTGVSYQWQIGDCAAGDFTNISSANGQGFALVGEHKGKFIRVSVIGDEGSSAVSNASGPVLMSEVDAVAADKANLGIIPSIIRADAVLTLPTFGVNGSNITWGSSNTSVITSEGSVTLPETENAKVTLTATFTCGGTSDTKTLDILVYSRKAMKDENSDAAVYLANAVESLKWYHLTPVYGTDTNINTVLKAALIKSGYGDLAVSVKSVKNPDDKSAAVAENGDITYYYSDPNALGSREVTGIPVTFTLSKGGTSAEYKIAAVIGWNLDKVNTYLNTEIISAISVANTAEENFDLPKYIGGKGGKTWVELSYSVSDESALTISAEKQIGSADNIYNPYVGKIKTLPADRTATLTVTAEFNYSHPAIKVSKTYSITVKGNPVAAEALRKELSAKLDTGFTSNGLTDYVTGTKLTEKDGVYTAANDIKLPTTKDFGVDGKYYPVALKSSDTDVLVTPNVNNAARVYVYRPLPGEAAKKATLTVTLTDKATGISAFKEFVISVTPLTQEEIDAEIKLMSQVKSHYFDGIKNENTSADNISGNLHAFHEAYLNNGTLTWAYDSKDTVNHGIVPVAMDGWETLEQWRAFRSSNSAVISHENLLVTRQTESKAVTITSYLSSEVYGKYAEKYPESADFQKLYYQPVTARLIVTGTAPTATVPVAETLTVSFALQSSSSTWISKRAVSGLPEGTTAFEVFTQVLRDSGYGYSSRGSYVYAVTTPGGSTLEELDEGTNSGWMYKVNGVIPSSYLAACPLKNGDNVVVFFTKDYTLEEGLAQWSTTKETTKTDGVLNPTVTAQDGKAEATVASEAIKSALSQNNGKVVIAPKITGSAESVSVSIPASSFKEIAENASGTLSVETDCGSVSLPSETLASVSGQAGSSDIKMTIKTKSAKEVKLPESDLENAAIVEISISSGGKDIRSFDGGSLGISIPVTGNYKIGESYKVIVLSSDGTVETLVGKVTTINGSSFVEVSVKHLSTFVVTNTPVAVFDDVKSDAWYYDAVQYTIRKGIMKGIAETTFAPNVEISRAMLVTVLYRLAGAPAVSGENSFSDVPKGAWYTDAIIWASKSGIVNGRGNGSFGTDENVTREEAAAILYRYAEFRKLDVSKTTELSGYTDSNSVNDWSQSAMRWANASGIITGCATNTLSPNGSVTRAQTATMLMRLDDYSTTAVKN